MVSGDKIPSVPPLRPPGAGPGPRASCDFLGLCPHRRSALGGFLGGFNFIDEADLDFDEFLRTLRVIDLDDDSEDEDFDELIEYYDNQRW